MNPSPVGAWRNSACAWIDTSVLTSLHQFNEDPRGFFTPGGGVPRHLHRQGVGFLRKALMLGGALLLIPSLAWADPEPVFTLDPMTEAAVLGSGLGVNLTALALKSLGTQGATWNTPLDGRRFGPSETADRASKVLTVAALLTPSACWPPIPNTGWG